MKNNTKITVNGAAIALAVAGLMGCAQTASQSSAGTAAPGGSAAANVTDLAHCYGVNKCNGHNDCKTAENACAGKASCKGQGFVAIPAKACKDIGGSVKDDRRGEVKTADLSHCYGVNVCAGHNDCKSATNACAGKATCKGHGFVAMPAKACADVGGKVKS